ncbi:MAG: hypothetical protein KKA67_05025 [Spirochaetes bacterium]|nr:hypothetical protein [Spirochaetota bacterium]MBU1081695.1 hypothetical protein [Spirochaetota bacterium]
MNTDSLEKKFSLGRVALLIRNRAYDDAPGLGIGLAILFGLNILTLIIGRTAFMNESPEETYVAAIVLAGILLSSLAFKGMHSGKSGTDWILLPATPLEKYAAALATYLVAFPLAASGALIALSAVLSLLERLAGGPGNAIWHPFTLGTARDYGEYAAVAVAFLAGSATFRKRAILKTTGLAVAYVLACALLVYAGLALLYGPASGRDFSVSYDTGVLRVFGTEVADASGLERIFRALVDGVRLALVPGFSLAFGYFRVAEKEARDEVQ